MEFINEKAGVYDSTVVGCERFNADIMISFEGKEQFGDESIVDLFLTNEQAKELIKELTVIISKNEKNG